MTQWGGISLARDITPRPLNDNPPRIWNSRRSELIQRLTAEVCELCGSTEQVEVHHIRALKDVNPKGRKQQPDWVTRMASRRRKTLVVCRVCHEDIHAGRPTRTPR
ncbi:HNH endonuclease [Nonomuraea sp. NPDC003707]